MCPFNLNRKRFSAGAREEISEEANDHRICLYPGGFHFAAIELVVRRQAEQRYEPRASAIRSGAIRWG